MMGEREMVKSKIIFVPGIKAFLTNIFLNLIIPEENFPKNYAPPNVSGFMRYKGSWESFLHTAGNQAVQLRRRSGAAIRVQPTTIARRLPLITRGSKRLPSGRPAKNEIILKKRQK
ncbi:Uncharacterized protein FWK35_00027157 [Aphis craccivora]|uniref:Uncharacterized protein n=1 Tax=Aphis craccivora TaxID=307492 RepID=A0A6G0WBN3_APHCR|nr:Uncharacterized protein FWK35_00027157 [Aphis craccivora]